MARKITLITMGAGNVKALKKTFDSFGNLVDEFIYGDLLLFPDDRRLIKSYQTLFNLKIERYPFDFIFENGFSAILNDLASRASNDLIIYMNTSEAIEKNNGFLGAINSNPDCNCFYFDHSTDPHRWYRTYDRRDLAWSGMIHEELTGEFRPYHKPIFTMMDYEKDMDDPFKAKVFNDLKEIVYFTQLLNLAQNHNLQGATSSGWIQFAHEQEESMLRRLADKGERYKAVVEGDYRKYIAECYKTLGNEIFETNHIIEFQGDPKYLGKNKDDESIHSDPTLENG